MKRRLVYIAGPYRGKDAWEVEENIRAAEQLGYEVAQHGHVPVIPHTMYRYFNGTLNDDYWLDATKRLMLACDCVLLLPGWERSEGATEEKNAAMDDHMPVFTKLSTLLEYYSPENILF